MIRIVGDSERKKAAEAIRRIENELNELLELAYTATREGKNVEIDPEKLKKALWRIRECLIVDILSILFLKGKAKGTN
jgi:hypothetical protein